MYKLVFIILTLSGFLIYKALTIKGANKTNFKSKTVAVNPVKSLGSAGNFSVSKTSASRAASAPAQAQAQKALPSDSPQTGSDSQSMKEDFDSLRDVFHPSEEVDETRVSPQEKEAHNETVRLIKKIEAEAAAAAQKDRSKGINKRFEDLTPEEQKQFEIYNSFEKKDDPNESK